jgi:hypothetical protein
MIDEILTPPTPTMFLFPDEAAWINAARAAGFMTTDEEGAERLATFTKDRAIDVIGTITRGGEWDDEGNVITPPTVLDGYHINYQGKLPEGWEQYAVYPKTPVRSWF